MGGSTSEVSSATGVSRATEDAIKQDIDTTIINDMLYESVTNNESVNENTMENIQNLELNVKRNIGCNIETDQTINPGFMASTDQIVDSFQSVTDGITTNLMDQAKAAIQKQADLGNISDADISDINQTVKNRIENEVKSVMETNNITKTINDAVNVQGQKINIGETIFTGGEQLSFRQNITADLAAQAISKKILKKLASTEEMTDIAMEGLFDEDEDELAAASEESSGRGPLFYGLIIGGVLLILIVVIILLTRKKKIPNVQVQHYE